MRQTEGGGLTRSPGLAGLGAVSGLAALDTADDNDDENDEEKGGTSSDQTDLPVLQPIHLFRFLPFIKYQSSR